MLLTKPSATAPRFIKAAAPKFTRSRLTQTPSTVPRSTMCVAKATPVSEKSLHPAVLPGTPADFPIKPEELIAKAKILFTEHDVGVKDASMLADDFRFEFPVVSLPREEFLKAVSGFNLRDAFPNIDPHPYDWRVDPYEPNRVWFTVRNTAVHTGPLKFFSQTFKPTNKVVYGAPECMSFLFNAEGKCTSYTGGYVMDRRCGNTQGLGAMFGILAAIGGPVLKPGSFAFVTLLLKSMLGKAASGVFHFFTLGMFRKKDKTA